MPALSPAAGTSPGVVMGTSATVAGAGEGRTAGYRPTSSRLDASLRATTGARPFSGSSAIDTRPRSSRPAAAVVQLAPETPSSCVIDRAQVSRQESGGAALQVDEGSRASISAICVERWIPVPPDGLKWHACRDEAGARDRDHTQTVASSLLVSLLPREVPDIRIAPGGLHRTLTSRARYRRIIRATENTSRTWKGGRPAEPCVHRPAVADRCSSPIDGRILGHTFRRHDRHYYAVEPERTDRNGSNSVPVLSGRTRPAYRDRQFRHSLAGRIAIRVLSRNPDGSSSIVLAGAAASPRLPS